MVAEKEYGAERDRTDDPLRARQVLSQLSYSPIIKTHVNASIFTASESFFYKNNQ